MRIVLSKKQVFKMKKASVLIIALVLLAALLCIVGCSSDVEYTDEETGITVSLPDGWEEDSDLEKDICFLSFWYQDSEDVSAEVIDCFLAGKASFENITDYPEEYFRYFFSAGVEVNDVEEEELWSGTYYKVTASSDEAYYVDYFTVENNYLIQFVYCSQSADTPHLSDFEDMVNLAEFGSSSSEESASSSDTDGAKGDSYSVPVAFCDPDTGIIGWLSSDWTSASADELEDLGFDSDTFAYCSCDNGSSSEYILGQKQKNSGYKGQKITDYPKEYISELYSDAMAVDSVKKKKLDSGTYYQIKGTDEDNNYYVSYEIIKNGYDIRFRYASTGGKSDTPHLSDFKQMVDEIDYDLG